MSGTFINLQQLADAAKERDTLRAQLAAANELLDRAGSFLATSPFGSARDLSSEIAAFLEAGPDVDGKLQREAVAP
jgi:hypothetical protein